MEQTHDADFLLMMHAFDGYRAGVFPRDDLLTFLKWEMAVTEDKTVARFITEIQIQDPDRDLSYEVARTHKYVRHWDFPEEPGIASALPEAIECTFPELIQSVARAVGQLGRLRNLLAGVNVRLDLRDSNRAVDEALRLVNDELAVLERACEVIGLGAGIAHASPSEDAGVQLSWASSDGAPLSPKQILGLSNMAKWNYPDYALTYADGIRAHSTPPQLVSERIRAREQQELRDAESRELESRMQEAMLRVCPRCLCAPGASCRTSGGKKTAIHMGRYSVAL